MIKLGMDVTDELNISAVCTRRKKPTEPGNRYLEIGYAHIEAITICPTVPTTVINTVLKIYRENGTQESDIR